MVMNLMVLCHCIINLVLKNSEEENL